MPKKNLENLLENFPIFRSAETAVKEDIMRNMMWHNLPAGKIIYRTGDECSHFALVISGSIRVYNISPDGNEITYYRVKGGESCFLTASCLLEGQTFPALAIVEKEADAAVFPSSIILEWIKKYEIWNRYVLSLISGRMTHITKIMNHLTFCNMDCRVATIILDKSFQTNPVQITHSEIAREIGTAREVVSRVLKEFEKNGLVNLSRNSIQILNPGGLQRVTEVCS